MARLAGSNSTGKAKKTRKLASAIAVASEKEQVDRAQEVINAGLGEGAVKAAVEKAADDLAEREEFERLDGALETAKAASSTSTSTSTEQQTTKTKSEIDEGRRGFFRFIGNFLGSTTAVYAMEKVVLDPSSYAVQSAVEAAQPNRRFDLPPALAIQLMERRSSVDRLNELQLEASFQNEDAHRLVGIIKNFALGRGADATDITFLNEIASGDCCNEVRYLAANHLSSELNRAGRPDIGLLKLTNFASTTVPSGQLANHFVQLINLTYNQRLSSEATNSSLWGIAGFLEDVGESFQAEVGFKFRKGKLEDVSPWSNAAVRRASTNLKGVYPHIMFFALHHEANRLSDVKARRDLWDSQLELYRKLLNPAIVGTPYTWQVWNHLFLLALSAERLGDIDYRNRFLLYLVGVGEGLWQGVDVADHILERQANLNEQYVFAAILIEYLKLRGDKLPGEIQGFDTEFSFLIRLTNYVPNTAARRALERFAKLYQRANAAPIRRLNYLTSIISHDIYVPPLP